METLHKSKSDYRISGVCGGIAEWMDTSSFLIRLLAILIAFGTGFFPAIIGYFLIAWAMPDDED